MCFTLDHQSAAAVKKAETAILVATAVLDPIWWSQMVLKDVTTSGGFNGIQWWFNGDSMGFNGISWDFNGILMGFNGI